MFLKMANLCIHDKINVLMQLWAYSTVINYVFLPNFSFSLILSLQN